MRSFSFALAFGLARTRFFGLEVVEPAPLLDFDERPVCFQDVDTLEVAESLARDVSESTTGFNVDFSLVYDDQGTQHGRPPWESA